MLIKPTLHAEFGASVHFSEAEIYLLSQLFEYSVMAELLKMSSSFDQDHWRKFIPSLQSQIENAKFAISKLREEANRCKFETTR